MQSDPDHVIIWEEIKHEKTKSSNLHKQPSQWNKPHHPYMYLMWRRHMRDGVQLWPALNWEHGVGETPFCVPFIFVQGSVPHPGAYAS